MPRLELSAAESLMITLTADETNHLRERARKLEQEAQDRDSMALRAVFDSHKETPPEKLVTVRRDGNGRPVFLEWEK